MLKRGLAYGAAVVAVGAIALPATSGADAPQFKKTTVVNVEDDFFSPTELTVKRDSKIKWSWAPDNLNPHNVVLQKGPKGVKKGCKDKGKDAFSPLISKCNESTTGAIGIKFTKKMDVAGSYSFLCTIHPTVMKLDVKVKK